MKTLIILLALLSTTVFAQQKGTITDSRDKKKYKTVKIGEKTWMAENLNYANKTSVCYDNKPANCTKYGRLYLMGVNLMGEVDDICPKGWHVATTDEWKLLTGSAFPLKAKTGWNDGGNGTDSLGFTALPGGYSKKIDDDEETKFTGLGNYSYLWTWGGSLACISSEVFVDTDPFPQGGKAYASVRCVQDYAEFLAMKKARDEEIAKRKAEEAERLKKEAEEDAKRKAEEEAKKKAEADAMAKIAAQTDAYRKANGGTFTDPRDKKTYKTIKIGKQLWMAENLNHNLSGSKCYNDKQENCDKYGRLYDREMAMKVCPAGWHLSSAADWDRLTTTVGERPGIKLKAASGYRFYLNNHNSNGTDEFAFYALAANSETASWWTSDEFYNQGRKVMYYYYREVSYSNNGLASNNDAKSSFHSVRCVKDDEFTVVPSSSSQAAAKPAEQGEVWCAGSVFGKKWCNKMPDPSTCAMSAGKVVTKCP